MFLVDVVGSLRVSCIKPVSKTAYITETPFSSNTTDKNEDYRMGREAKTKTTSIDLRVPGAPTQEVLTFRVLDS